MLQQQRQRHMFASTIHFEKHALYEFMQTILITLQAVTSAVRYCVDS